MRAVVELSLATLAMASMATMELDPPDPWHQLTVGVATHGHLLKQWIAQQSGESDLVVIAEHGPLGNGVELGQSVSADQLVLSIPPSAVMSVDSAFLAVGYGAALGRLAGRQILDSTGVLALHLIKERLAGAHSKFAPYIAMLPEEPHSIPSWTSDELAMLTGTSAAEYFTRQVQPRVEEFQLKMQQAAEWEPKLLAFQRVILNWAWAIVATRAYEFPHHSDLFTAPSPHLVPLADLVNHQSDRSTLLLRNSGVYELQVNNFSTRGEPLWQSYSNDAARCDAHWLIDYGFLPNVSAADPVARCIPLELQLPDTLADWKLSLLEHVGRHFVIQQDGAVSDDAAYALRVLLANSPEDVISAESPFGSMLEDASAATQLQNAMRAMLNRIHKSTRVPSEMSSRSALAIELRKREENLLERALAKLDMMRKRVLA